MNAKWISTLSNKIVDMISRSKNLLTILPQFNMTFQTLTGPCGIETLLFLPAKSRASHNDLGYFIDSKLPWLKQGSTVETERFRQAQYLKWCKQMLIPDPCVSEPGYELLVAYFIEYLKLNCNS